MKTLTVTDEAVKNAAAQCPDARRVLQTMFPEVFANPPIAWPFKELLSSADGESAYIETRALGNYSGCGLYLSHNARWEIVKDDEGIQVLIARRK